MNEANRKIIQEFRTNGGKVGGGYEATPLLILHTTGAKTGVGRVNPVMYQPLESGDLAVFAAKGGAPTNPDWYHNLVATPRATVEVGTETFEVTAHVADPVERKPIWDKLKADFPAFGDFEQTTPRQIPVVILSPVR